MFYLTSKFHVNRINTFGFMEGGLLKPPPPPQAQELQKSPGRIGLTLKWSGGLHVTIPIDFFNLKIEASFLFLF